MHVPEGTKPLTSWLPAIARDPMGYGGVMFELGKILGNLKQQTGTLPLPVRENPFLDRIALVFDDKAASSTFLSPTL